MKLSAKAFHVKWVMAMVMVMELFFVDTPRHGAKSAAGGLDSAAKLGPQSASASYRPNNPQPVATERVDPFCGTRRRAECH